MKLRVFTWLLLPFSWIYGLVVGVRNWLFDSQLLTSYRPFIYSVGVGNLTVGGTGKTPMIEFLIKRSVKSRSQPHKTTATLSRGYGRRSRGFRVATESDTAATIGDEPLQLFRKFGHWVRVCVGESRVAAIETLVGLHPETAVVLLDDAFQHRAVAPHVSILLMDYNRPFYRDYPFPAGRLREPRRGARRADVLVVTKCPLDLPGKAQTEMIHQLRRYTRPSIPIFFAGIQYGHPVAFGNQQEHPALTHVVLVSGLANADPLEQYVRKTFGLLHHHRFADHYAYTRTDVERIQASLPSGACLLTTEKDWVKLEALLTPAEQAKPRWYYLPVATSFLQQQEADFLKFLEIHSLKNR